MSAFTHVDIKRDTFQPYRAQPRPRPLRDQSWPAIDEHCKWRAQRNHPCAVSIIWADLAEVGFHDIRLPALIPMLQRSLVSVRVRVRTAQLVAPDALCDHVSIENANTPVTEETLSEYFPRMTKLAISAPWHKQRNCLHLKWFRRLTHFSTAPGLFWQVPFIVVTRGADELTTVELFDVFIAIAQLASLPKLTSLTLRGGGATDLRPLAKSLSLKTLVVRAWSSLVTEGTFGLEKIPTLTSVTFDQVHGLGDLSHLRASTSIVSLHAPASVSVNLPGLRGMPHLATLVSCLYQREFDWLTTLPSLTELDVWNTTERTIDPVFRIVTLRKLSLHAVFRRAITPPPPAETWLCRDLESVDTNFAALLTAAAPVVRRLRAHVDGSELGPMNIWTACGTSRVLQSLRNASSQLSELEVNCRDELLHRPTECLRTIAQCTMLRLVTLRLDHVIDLTVGFGSLVHLEILDLCSRTVDGALAVLPRLTTFRWAAVDRNDVQRTGFCRHDHDDGVLTSDTEEMLEEPLSSFEPKAPRPGACDRVVDSLARQPSLKTVKLRCPVQITSLSALQHSQSVCHLDVSHCTNLVDVRGLERIPTLTTINVTNCFQVADVDCLLRAPSLQRIIRECPSPSVSSPFTML